MQIKENPKIGISLPIHEREDIFLNQLFNIKKFIPNSIVCTHLSANSSINHDFVESLSLLTGNIANKNRLNTKHGKGLMPVHISNFKILNEYKIDYILLISSNEMLVRPGLDFYISKFDAGLQICNRLNYPEWHLFNKKIEGLSEVQKFLDITGATDIHGGQAEGQFFNSKLFEHMVEIYEQSFPDNYFEFETEEIIPATYFSTVQFNKLKIGLPITFQNYSTELNIDENFIERIISGKGQIQGITRKSTLASPHLGTGKMDSIYSIKRIDRNMNKLRTLITNL